MKNNLTAHDGLYCCVWYTNEYESISVVVRLNSYVCICGAEKKRFFLSFRFQFYNIAFFSLISQSVDRPVSRFFPLCITLDSFFSTISFYF